MRALNVFLAGLCFALCTAVAVAAPKLPVRDRVDGLVVDYANIIPDDEEAQLESRMLALEKKTGVEFAVVTVQSLQGYEIEEYANGLFRYWGIGKQDVNNGILFLYSASENRRRIEVGPRLQGFFTDAVAKTLLVKTRPYFRGGDTGAGMVVISNQIVSIVDENSEVEALVKKAPPAAKRPTSSAGAAYLFLAFSIMGIIVLCAVALSMILGVRRKQQYVSVHHSYREPLRSGPRSPSRGDYGSRRSDPDDISTGAVMGFGFGAGVGNTGPLNDGPTNDSPSGFDFGGGVSDGGGASD